jgi:hypothetical protein
VALLIGISALHVWATLEVLDVARSSWITAALVLIVLLIPMVTTAWIPTYREAHLLTVSGTLTEAKPVNYLRSQQFLAKGNQLKIVLRMRANQQIDATIEVARIIGYYLPPRRLGETSEVRIFGMYPQKVMNRTQWDFRNDYSKTLYTSLEHVPVDLLGKAQMGLEIEIFLEGPNFSSNPTFLVYWEIAVYDVY